MKGVVGSFWFLTTFFGNILDVFFVGIKLWPTQAGEYIVLSIVMTGAALIFSMLAYFFYDYAEARISKLLFEYSCSSTTYENPYEDREDAEQEACTDKKEDTTDL